MPPASQPTGADGQAPPFRACSLSHTPHLGLYPLGQDSSPGCEEGWEVWTSHPCPLLGESQGL